MIEAYSINKTVTANSPVAFDNVTIQKGCTVTQSGDANFNLNKCGVYSVCVNATAAAETTLQLYKDGLALPQAQSTGTSLAFSTLVQVNHNNCGCCCSSPVNLQVMNTTAGTLDNINITISKLC